MEKKKILHVPYGGLGHGGVSTVIFSIVEALYSDYSFDSVVFKKRCDREQLFQKYGNVYRINAYNDNGKRNPIEIILRPIILYRGIKNLCKKEKYDVIHCHNETDEGICLLAAKNAKVPKRIAHSHNTPSPRKRSSVLRLYEDINKILVNRYSTDRVGCSDAACSSFFGANRSYKVIFNTVDLERFNYDNKIKHEGITFIHVGRYTYQKNQEFVVETFYKIHLKYDNSKLLLVGYGEDKEYLATLIRKLGLEKCVDLIPGDRVDVASLYAVSDYMIFPSRYEGFGIVLVEAQAMGIPCFVSEAIQKDADAGLLHYLDLSRGSDYWANYILEFINSDNTIDLSLLNSNLMKYSVESISSQYRMIYSNDNNG